MAQLENNENIIDLDLTIAKRQRFRINGDNNAIISLDLSDNSVYDRLNEAYPKMLDMLAQYQGKELSDDEAIEALKTVDADIRKLVNYIFDSEVADICCPSGYMIDLVEGRFRFEHLVERLTKLYSDNLYKEFRTMKARLSKHTDKYTKKKVGK